MRIGIFGGTFDPVHYGHLLLAESCREQCSLDEVWFVPAAQPPHKPARKISSAADRVEMLKLAIGGHPAFRIWNGEIERGGISYTATTLRAIRGELPEAELFLLLGTDMLSDLPTWRNPEEIRKSATLVVTSRAGFEESEDQAEFAESSVADNPSGRLLSVKMPGMEISSSDIRRRVAQGKSIRYLTPRGVEKYIETHQHYKNDGQPVM